MSMDEVYMILAVFGPLSSSQLMDCLGKSHASIYGSLRRLRKCGEVRWTQGKTAPGTSGGSPVIWEAL